MVVRPWSSPSMCNHKLQIQKHIRQFFVILRLQIIAITVQNINGKFVLGFCTVDYQFLSSFKCVIHCGLWVVHQMACFHSPMNLLNLGACFVNFPNIYAKGMPLKTQITSEKVTIYLFNFLQSPNHRICKVFICTDAHL